MDNKCLEVNILEEIYQTNVRVDHFRQFLVETFRKHSINFETI